jgi:hypothetical protein
MPVSNPLLGPGPFVWTQESHQPSLKKAHGKPKKPRRHLVHLVSYLFLFPGLGLHSSPITGCSLILIGYCALFPLYPLLQS